MRIETVTAISSCVALFGVAAAKEPQSELLLYWSQLPPLPDKEGFAGAFVGISNGSLLVAGGANFPQARIWEGGKNKWYDLIYVLDKPTGKWRIAKDCLPRPLAYGASASWKDIMICAGGSDGERHYDNVYAVRLVNDRIQFEPLPPLPETCADMCCCLVGSQLFIAGGTKRPGATAAMHTFWRLELAVPKDKMRWEVLKPWPGPERSNAVAATLGKSFFLISGFRWESGPTGDAVRSVPFLNDAYRYTPNGEGNGIWQRIADLPRAVAAAPSPAMTLDGQEIAVIGGIDDTIGNLKAQTHPGFRRDVFIYDAVANQWTIGEQIPVGTSRVAVSSAQWHDQYILASGERAPSIRSPEVYAIRTKSISRPSGPP